MSLFRTARMFRRRCSGVCTSVKLASAFDGDSGHDTPLCAAVHRGAVAAQAQRPQPKLLKGPLASRAAQGGRAVAQGCVRTPIWTLRRDANAGPASASGRIPVSGLAQESNCDCSSLPLGSGIRTAHNTHPLAASGLGVVDPHDVPMLVPGVSSPRRRVLLSRGDCSSASPWTPTPIMRRLVANEGSGCRCGPYHRVVRAKHRPHAC